MRPERTSTMAPAGERGMALVAAMLIMLLMSALLISFTTAIMNEQRYRGIDKDRVRAYYGAQSGLEKLTVDMGNLFLTNIAPTAAQISALSLTANQPVIPGITFSAPAGVTAYGANLVACDNLGDTTCNATVQTGPYQGLIALKKSYQLDAVAVTAAGGEAHLLRKLELVSIPVFQFGTFSTVDLSFFAGSTFTFGGRVHSNGNLFLTAQDTYTTTLTDKVTAVGDIIRQTMQNGLAIAAAGFNGTVSMAKASNSFRNMAITDGSLTGGVGSSANTNWPTISLSTYNGYIRNGGCPPATGCAVPARGTGAKALNLALVTVGGTNTDLTRRPPSNELVTNPVLFGERMFGKTSVRILLSDTAAEITSLPTVTATAPVRLGDEGTIGVGLTNDWSNVLQGPPAGITLGGTAIPSGGGLMPPIARSPGPQTIATSGATAAGATTIPIVGANPAGVFNVPGALGLSSMQFTINNNLGAFFQTINCLTVTATSTTQITFGSCLRGNASGGLQTVPAGYQIVITDLNGTTHTYTTTGTVSSTSNNTTTRNYVVTSTNAFNALVTNTFWMQSTAATKDWLAVTCSGITTNTNTANAGPWTATALSSCNNVPATVAGAGVITTAALASQNVGATGGYIKIEIQKADFTWKDVTAEVLNWGFADNNQDGTICGDPTPNAIVRLQRLRDNGGTSTVASGGLGCPYAGSTNSYDFWPNTIFDTREALFRSVAPATNDAMLGGVMHYVALDVGNLSKWLAGTAPYGAGSGNQALSVSGYTVYFSDRRNNRSDGSNSTCLDPNLPAPCATGEYGFEDVVNSTNAAGTPNGALDAGEDVNGNGLLDTYGQFPNFLGAINTVPPGAALPLNATARPNTAVGRAAAMTSRALLFRRALKLQNGGQGNIVLPGLTVATENPLYIQGDWNWNGSALTASHAETSVIADAVTLLSTAWTDANAFENPYDASQRTRAAAGWYRIAIVGGKSMAFTWPTVGGPDSTFGTDGGVHNFLRYLETGAGTVNYVGSTATFYYSRQGVGVYKFNISGTSVVYSAPTRAYAFDTDFLNPATLPPLTPVFRDVNILGFSQEMRPGK